MGSGRNGSFDLSPDLQQWALLATWDNSKAFHNFYRTSFVARWWKSFCYEQWTILGSPLSGHGKWDNIYPFEYEQEEGYEGPIAVLTRATIRLNRLKEFWTNVDTAAAVMARSPGFMFSLGVGEAPVYRQATFSIWESIEAVKNYAYNSPEHREIIHKTRARNWYSEELFARFKPIASFGTLNGKNPVKL